MTTSEAILGAAKLSVQAHGFGGLNIRQLADEVGIKAASIYHHFPSKADLAAAVARRYWEDTAADLDAIAVEAGDPLTALLRYPQIFRRSLENENRLCLGSFMSAEYDDIPETVQVEVQKFADANVAWLAKQLDAASIATASAGDDRAKAIFAAVAGAQLMARSRADLALFDAVIDGYRNAGLLPGH